MTGDSELPDVRLESLGAGWGAASGGGALGPFTPETCSAIKSLAPTPDLRIRAFFIKMVLGYSETGDYDP